MMSFLSRHWLALGLMVGLVGCAPAATPAGPAATAAPTDAATEVVAAAPTARPSLVFATVVPSATPERQLTPTVSPQAGGAGLPTLTPVPVSQGQPVVVDLVNFAFRPPQMSARVGAPITLILRNLDIATPHVFEIIALEISVVLGANEEKTITFTVDKPGRYEFTCPLETTGVNHAMAGMIGELWVTP